MRTNPNSRYLGQIIGAAVAALIVPLMVLRMEPDTTGSNAPLSSQSPVAIDQEGRHAGADESWWQAVSAKIEREEYAAQSTEQALQAPNRAHNLRTTFGERGIEVVPRSAKGVVPAWRFTWQTTGFGRPGRIEEVSPSPPTTAGARVVYQRDHWSEWYENTAKGLEQGFTLDRRPAGEGPIQIAGAFPAALRPVLREDGAVDFLNEQDACAIRYGELHVWDAEEQELSAKLVLTAGNTLAIEIDDQGAVYPILVDPLMTSPAWIAESNQANAFFGESVATAGDVNGDGFSDVIVGAHQYDNGETDEGRAFVYHGSAVGLSTTPAWTAESNQAGAAFGVSVATAGDVNGDGFSDVIVGAYFYNNGESFEGRVFAYHGSAGGLSTTPTWTAESNQANAQFGRSVATAGDVNGDGFSDVIVGAYGYDNEQSGEGRAFVFHGSATGLLPAAAWTAESNQADAFFGMWVATAGDVNGDGYSDVIVGANRYDNGQADEGRAFAYHGSAAGLATTAAWITESNQGDARFGNSVATAGDLNGDGYGDVIVGAPQYDNGETDEGRAFTYHGSAAGLAATPARTTESNQASAFFANSVATAGDVNGDGYADVIVGASGYDNGEINEGGTFVFHGSATGLLPTAAWTAESNQGSASFGNSGTAGDVNGDGYADVIVGALSYDNGENGEGRAFVYHGSGAGLATTAGWIAEGNHAGSNFGFDVASAGDVNGDSYSDVIVGAPDYNGRGRAFVYHGSPTGLSTIPAWIADSDQIDASFGLAVAGAGDVNGDGFSDVIVGAYSYDNGEIDEGRAFAYHGSAMGLEAAPAWTAESNQAGARFGGGAASVASAGDVNGDGYSDVIVGSTSYANGEPGEGGAFVYHGSAMGLEVAPAWTAGSNQAFATIGSVETAGDVNGDGYSDVIIGAPEYDNGESNEGRAFTYHGSETGLGSTPAWIAESNQAGANFGTCVGTAGDVNGDGYSDVIVSAWEYDNGEPDEGRAFAYYGSATGLATAAAWTAEPNQPDASFASVGTAGDVNGDGYSDVILGAFTYDNGQTDEGRAFAYYGSAVGLATTAAWTAEPNQASSGFGGSVTTAGDVNGDGFSDVIVGAEMYAFLGRAFVYYGNDGDGLDRIPRQTRTDGSAPVWLLGNSDSDSAFRLQVLGRTPAGRGRVRLQYEVKPAGILFDGTGLVTGAVTNTGTPGANGSAVELSQLANGLTAEMLYHWRVRILTDSPFFPRSRWLSLPYNGVTEADVRTAAATTAVHEQAVPPAGVSLAPPTPNPFNPRTTIAYQLPARMQARVAIHDVQGRLVRTLVDEAQPAGHHEVEWDGRDSRGGQASTGIYFSRLEVGGEVRSRKLALVK